ncbi:MAG TPA: hypothetical protein VNS09_16090 [Solirubrobacter sp.]|nr:hypothetical protein [Solirubrobacter sp.]
MVKLETGGVSRVVRDLDRADDAGRRASKSTDGLDKSLRNVRSSAAGTSDEVAKAERQIRTLHNGFSQASASIASATDELDRTGRVSRSTLRDLKQLGNEGVDGLDKRMSRSRETLRRAQAEIAETGNVSRRTRRDLDGLGDSGDDTHKSFRRLLSDFGGGGLTRNFGDMTASLGPLRGGLDGIVTITATLGPVLLAASGATVALVSALGPLVGLGPAAAVGLGALAQAAGVVALASAGVGDALKEQLDAQDKATKMAISSTGQQRAAARAIQQAQDGVRQAKDRAAQASRSLSDAETAEKAATVALTQARVQAKRGIEDMKSGLVRAVLDEKDAILALQDAKKALDQTLKGPDPADVADAQDAVADAARGQTQATLNLAKAQERLAQANGDPSASDADRAQAALDVADAENAIGDAQRNRVKAEKALADLQKGPDPEEVAKAKLNVAKAEQQVSDATKDRARQEKDTAAAVKAGVAGSKEVVTARQQLARATRSVTDAEKAYTDAARDVRKAEQAVTDARADAASGMAKTALAAQQLNEKFAALPPAAQAFVRKLIELKPRLDELRAIAAAGLFPGVVKGIEAAQGAFEPLKRVVGETAGTLGGLAERAGELVGSKGFGKDLQTIGHRNALVLDRTGRATFYLAGAMKDLIVAAGPLTTWLAKATLEWARNVKASTEAGRESGRLADFFQRTKNTLQTVGSILGNPRGRVLRGRQSRRAVRQGHPPLARRCHGPFRDVGEEHKGPEIPDGLLRQEQRPDGATRTRVGRVGEIARRPGLLGASGLREDPGEARPAHRTARARIRRLEDRRDRCRDCHGPVFSGSDGTREHDGQDHGDVRRAEGRDDRRRDGNGRAHRRAVVAQRRADRKSHRTRCARHRGTRDGAGRRVQEKRDLPQLCRQGVENDQGHGQGCP